MLNVQREANAGAEQSKAGVVFVWLGRVSIQVYGGERCAGWGGTRSPRADGEVMVQVLACVGRPCRPEKVVGVNSVVVRESEWRVRKGGKEQARAAVQTTKSYSPEGCRRWTARGMGCSGVVRDRRRRRMSR